MRGLLLQLVGEQPPVLVAAAEAVDQLVLAQHLLAGQLAGDAVGVQLGPAHAGEHLLVPGLQRGVEPLRDGRGEVAQVLHQLIGNLAEDVLLQVLRLLVEDVVPSPHVQAFYGAPGNPRRAYTTTCGTSSRYSPVAGRRVPYAFQVWGSRSRNSRCHCSAA